MPSEASRKKAEGFVDGIAGDVSDIYGSDGRGHWVESLAAALDEVRREWAERERWECYAAATLAFAQFRGVAPAVVERRVSEAIAARGAMRGPEEE